MKKRLLLKTTLQNLTLDGNKTRFDWIKPFDQIAFYASRSDWLPSSPFILYKLFPNNLVAQVKVQLDVLKDILASKPDYSTIKVKNGRICKLPAQC